MSSAPWLSSFLLTAISHCSLPVVALVQGRTYHLQFYPVFCIVQHTYAHSLHSNFVPSEINCQDALHPYNQQVVDIEDTRQAESCPDFLYLMSNFLNRTTVLECLNIKHALSFRLEITCYMHLLLWISVSFLGLLFLHWTELTLYQLGIFPFSSPVLGLLIWICLVHVVIFYRVNDNLRNYWKDQDTAS